MAEKSFIFEIEVRGDKKAAKSISDIQENIKALRQDLKKADVGSEAYKALEQEIGRASEKVKELGREQKKALKAAALDANVPNSYRAWEAELGLLNEQLKDLSETDINSTVGKNAVKRINELQDKLKDFDANVGRYNRNVGNYANGFTKALVGSKIASRIQGISQQFGDLGSLVAGAGVAGAVVAGVVKIGEAVGNMVKEFDEAKKAVQTFGGDTVENAQKASEGVLATSKAFSVSSEEITKAAAQLAKANGTSFEDALDRINNGLVNGQEDASKYLETIAEFPSKFSEASSAIDETGKAQRRADLERQKELAAAQGKLSESFAKLSATVAPAIDFIKTSAVKAVTFLLDYWNGLASAIGTGFELLKAAGQETIDFFNRAVNVVTGGLAGVSALEQDARDRANEERAKQAELEKKLNAEIEQENEARLKRLKKGLGDAFGQVTEQQRFAFTSAITFAEINARGAGKSAAEVTAEGFKAGLATLPADIRSQFDENRKVLTDEQKKAQAEAAQKRKEANKQARKDAKEAAEKLAADRAEFQKTLVSQREQEAAVLLDLTSQLLDAQIDLIASEKEKTLALENKAFADAQNERTKQYEKQAADLGENLKRAVELYGEGSKEVQSLEVQNQSFLLQIQQTYFQINEAEQTAHNARVLAIEKDSASKLATEKIEQLQRELEVQNQIFEQGQQIQDERDRAELLALRALGKDKEAVELESLRQKREAVIRQIRQNTQEEVKAAQAQQGLTGLTPEQQKQLEAEKNARLVAREKLNNDLYELDLDLEEKTTELGKKSAADRTKQISEIVTNSLGFASQGLAAVADLQKTIADAAVKQIAEQQDARNKSIEALKAEKETQIGLEAEFTQQKIDNETKALEELNARKKEIEDEQKKEAKQTAIIQSIINTAVAVTKALPNPVLATITGVLGAIQTAAIIAQPLAEGGIVQPYENVSGGRVTQRSNVAKSAKGDSVLAYLSPNEVVLTQENVANIPESVLANAGVRGFNRTDTAPNPNLFVQSAPASAQPNYDKIASIVSETVIKSAIPYMNAVASEKVNKIEVSLDPRKVSEANAKQAKLDSNLRF